MERIYAQLQTLRLVKTCLSLLTLTFILSAAGIAFAQSTLDICKGTQEAIDRYKVNYFELNNTLSAIEHETEMRDFLSKVNYAIADGRVTKEMFQVAESMGLTKLPLAALVEPYDRDRPEYLALQKQVRDAMVTALQRARTGNGPELRSQLEEIRKQILGRQNRMKELDCDSVLAAAAPAPAAAPAAGNQNSGAPNFTGLWVKLDGDLGYGRVRLVQTGNTVAGTHEHNVDGVWRATGRYFDGVAVFKPPQTYNPKGTWELTIKSENLNATPSRILGTDGKNTQTHQWILDLKYDRIISHFGDLKRVAESPADSGTRPIRH